MHPRAAQLIESLKLTPHPEGGRYCEVYRSASRVRPADGRPERPSLTTIYFLLCEGEVSQWHRVKSDEVWHFYEGDVLELSTRNSEFESSHHHQVGRPGENIRPAMVVPAGIWQSARTTGAYTLVGCTVAPGFDFVDFEMLPSRVKPEA